MWFQKKHPRDPILEALVIARQEEIKRLEAEELKRVFSFFQNNEALTSFTTVKYKTNARLLKKMGFRVLSDFIQWEVSIPEC